MKEQLVEMTGLSPRVIRVWFQNKRCKHNKKTNALKIQMEQEKVRKLSRINRDENVNSENISSTGDEANWLWTNAWSAIDRHQPGEKWRIANQPARIRGDVFSTALEDDFRSRHARRLEK